MDIKGQIITINRYINMDYVIYTDGAYSKSKDLGAFVFIIVDENENEVCRMGHVTPSETNNRQELKAIIAAVSKLPDDARKVRIISDSMYALNTLSGEWMRRANHDLFKLWEKTNREKAIVELDGNIKKAIADLEAVVQANKEASEAKDTALEAKYNTLHARMNDIAETLEFEVNRINLILEGLTSE